MPTPANIWAKANVTMGKIDLAKEQLTEIKRICGTTCEQFAELNEAIEEAVKAAGAE